MAAVRHIVLRPVKGGQHGIHTVSQRRIRIHKSMSVVAEEVGQRHSSESPFVPEHRIQ